MNRMSPRHSKILMQHFENPHNVGSLDEDSPRVGTGAASRESCGDVIRLQIEAGDDGIIADAKFKTFGSASAIAAGSLATTMIIGKTVEQALRLESSAIAEELQLPLDKIHCADLAAGAVRAAVENWQVKNQSAG